VQILTSVVKLFLKKPHEAQDLVSRVLAAATTESDHPDLRDRYCTAVCCAVILLCIPLQPVLAK
jgi:vesicle coat complex subunit